MTGFLKYKKGCGEILLTSIDKEGTETWLWYWIVRKCEENIKNL